MEVDGVRYWVTRYADVDQRRRVVSSSLVVRPDFEPTAGGSTQYISQRGTSIVSIKSEGRKIVAETNTVYFVHEGRIKFKRKYDETGIDSSRLNAELDDMLTYLQPILEKMIREILKQEAEE
jgi:hypothetical protein